MRAYPRLQNGLAFEPKWFRALIMAVVILIPNIAGAQSKPPRILALGDSLTAGYGLQADQAFPVRLEQELRARGCEARVVNAGVSGDTTASGLARLDWLLNDPSGAVDAAIVELGANDGLRGMDPARMESNLRAIIAAFQKRGIPVLLTGMYAPPNMGGQYAAQYNAVFPRVAGDTGVLFMKFFLEGVAGNPDLNQNDGIHPNQKGVGVAVKRIAPYVEQLMERAGAGCRQ